MTLITFGLILPPTTIKCSFEIYFGFKVYDVHWTQNKKFLELDQYLCIFKSSFQFN